MTRRNWLPLAVAMAVAVALAIVWLAFRDRASDIESASGPLVIYSSTDRAVMAPVLSDFAKRYPRIRTEFVELDSTLLNDRFLAETQAARPSADILFSSAMDLQVKLVNDGHAQPYRSVATAQLPDWARWRNEAFGITVEPAAIVVNRGQLGGRTPPRSHLELLDQLMVDPAFWQGRIGTYDIAASSVGYLLAAQDDRRNSQFVNLVNVLGDRGVRTEDQSNHLLDRIENGELVLGYNVLSSYAERRARLNPNLTVIYPRDYTLGLSRTVVIPRAARNVANARLFLDYMLSDSAGKVLATQSGLIPAAVLATPGGSAIPVPPGFLLTRPITLGPGLLTLRDQHKRRIILERLGPLAGRLDARRPGAAAVSAR